MTSETALPDKRQVEMRLAKKREWILRRIGLQGQQAAATKVLELGH
jgi:hypothetical protein